MSDATIFRIRTLLDRSQLDRSRTQLQPHFVLATLQATSDILRDDPAAADAMVVGLSDLLRRNLAVGDEDVPLPNELDMINRYLELYQIGLGEKLVITLDVEEDVLNAAVPAMLLQPLVDDLTRARLRQLYADQQSFDVGTVHRFVITTVGIPFREMAARESDGTDRERETA